MSNDEKLTLLGHLKELRKRLFWIALAVVVTSAASFFFADQIFELLKEPARIDPLPYSGIDDAGDWDFTTATPGETVTLLSPDFPAKAPSLFPTMSNQPTLEATIPADGSDAVAVNQPLALKFSQDMAKGTGNILIHRSADGATVQTIPASSVNVTVTGNVVNVIHADLDPATDYYVTIDKGAFSNIAKEIDLIYIDMTEGFGTYMRVCIVAGLIAAMPFIVYQLLMFVMPALTRRERRIVLLVLPWITIMFAAGVYFGFRFLIPPALQFLLNFSADVANAQIRMGNYVSFVARLLLVIGVIFELPVITSLLARMGVIDHKWLASKRRWNILLSFVIAAIITPTPDPVNQSIVAGTLVLLYELSVWLALVFQKRRPKSEYDKFMADEDDYAAEDETEDDAETADEAPAPPTKHYDERDG